MSLAQQTPSPAVIAIAVATVDVTHTTAFHPATAADAWATLKEARGQTVNFEVLATSRPAHLILSAPAPALPAAPADLHEARIAARIRQRIATMGYARPGTGGDAA